MSAQILHLPIELPNGLSNPVEMACQELAAASRALGDQRRKVRMREAWDDEREMDLLHFLKGQRDKAERRYWRMRRMRMEGRG